VLDAAMPTLHNPLSCVMSARARKRLVGIADKRANTAQRQALATRALAGLKLVRHPASYFIWLPLGDD
jgi:DNA-binding transcriptional MocR family regulator